MKKIILAIVVTLVLGANFLTTKTFAAVDTCEYQKVVVEADSTAAFFPWNLAENLFGSGHLWTEFHSINPEWGPITEWKKNAKGHLIPPVKAGDEMTLWAPKKLLLPEHREEPEELATAPLTLPETPVAEEEKAGIPWWTWLLLALVPLTILVVWAFKKLKRDNNPRTAGPPVRNGGIPTTDPEAEARIATEEFRNAYGRNNSKVENIRKVLISTRGNEEVPVTFGDGVVRNCKLVREPGYVATVDGNERAIIGWCANGFDFTQNHMDITNLIIENESVLNHQPTNSTDVTAPIVAPVNVTTDVAELTFGSMDCNEAIRHMVGAGVPFSLGIVSTEGNTTVQLDVLTAEAGKTDGKAQQPALEASTDKKEEVAAQA